MKYIVKKIDGHKISLILAITMGVVSLFFYPFMLLSFAMMKKVNTPVMPNFSFIFIFFPIIYFIFGYIFTRIFCGLFNLITKKLNGFQIEVDKLESN